ncbi:unnamed protein product [Vitrella brassicaformis CCMP3155]|uniref:Gamma-glutamylcyclotransferase n=1 Tax=Vitrella brassicaformis (strain CCMP3155) TaxID=1169540 RepID=A0A0G4E959_VITBC|nr:unnamed protein product [Vitrella brassicaformis CCMP3155]|eukprot:CEL91736.1 unnamed protein product [Vitrella brassicaformis CCMP3155]
MVAAAWLLVIIVLPSAWTKARVADQPSALQVGLQRSPPSNSNSSSSDMADAATLILAYLDRHSAEMKAAIKQAPPPFAYPWSGLEDYVASRDDKSLPLLGYGSLVSKESASRHFSRDTVERGEVVIAFGAQRIFNYDSKHCRHLTNKQLGLPPTKEELVFPFSYDLPCSPYSTAMLNVLQKPITAPPISLPVSTTPHTLPIVSGAVYPLKAADIEGLRTREVGYSLLPVAYVEWEGLMDGALTAKFKVAFVCALPEASSCRVEAGYYPLPDYLSLCRDAQKSMGPLFEDLFDMTTLLADGKITAADWRIQRQKQSFLTSDHGDGCPADVQGVRPAT